MAQSSLTERVLVLSSGDGRLGGGGGSCESEGLSHPHLPPLRSFPPHNVLRWGRQRGEEGGPGSPSSL